MNNCIRGTKKEHAMSYILHLIEVQAFDVVSVGFFPMSHLNNDVDQCLSHIPARLRHYNALTLKYFHVELCYTETGSANVFGVKRISNL